MYWSIDEIVRRWQQTIVVPAEAGTQCRLRKTLDSRVRGNDRYFKSTSVKLNDPSGIVYTPTSFLFFADRSFSVTSGAHGASL